VGAIVIALVTVVAPARTPVVEAANQGLSATSALPAVSFRLPFADGESFRVTQGWNTRYSHNGLAAFAYDFAMPAGTPVLAAAAGRVSHLHRGSRACGGAGLLNQANYITIDHADGTATEYAHLSRVEVRVGDVVAAGQEIGRSGRSGWTGCQAHLHFARQAQGGGVTQSVPVYFEEYPGHEFTGGMLVESRRPPCIQAAVASPRNAFCSVFFEGDLAGPASLIRKDIGIDVGAGSGSAGATGGTSWPAGLTGSPGTVGFAARWVGTFDFTAGGSWDFAISTSDGVRLSIDGEILLDSWDNPEAPTDIDLTRSLMAGPHLIELEFHHDQGEAAVRLSWWRAFEGLQADRR
jgi:hypothetical protein